MGFFSKIKEKIGVSGSNVTDDVGEADYVEVDTDNIQSARAKIAVKPFVLENFDHVKIILDSLREGNTIALVNIKPLKDKDIIELKRAINKLKKTCDAIEGDIAGFGENWIAAVPSFAYIHRNKPASDSKEQEVSREMDE